jgi:alpha-L-rhamnosidase
MSASRTARPALTAVAVATCLLLPLDPTATAAPSTHSARSDVTVVDLHVDGRSAPVGIDNPAPLLGWRMTETPRVSGDPCHRPTSTRTCPGDRQTAYQIQAAANRRDLVAQRLLWDSGRVRSAVQSGVPYAGRDLDSRSTVVWRVRIWDALGHPSDWSPHSSWEMGLLSPGDWAPARWIEHPGRTENQPMPLFARQFQVAPRARVATARLYLSGVGLHLPTLNGRRLSGEVLAPGNSNYQLSSEYRTYDITSALAQGDNTLGVRLGNGPAYVRRSVTNPAVGRTAPYSWWQSQLKGQSVLAAAAQQGDTSLKLDSVANYHLGGTINIDTGNGGEQLESRTITSIGTAGAAGTGISFTPALSSDHAIGATVTGSGNNIAASDPSAGAAVTPRLIARMEIAYTDGHTDVIVSDRRWRTALGPLVTDAWYSGADHDARREQSGWDQADADLGATARRRDGTPAGWIDAGIAPPPNLATRLVARTAEPVTVAEKFSPVSLSQPVPGTWAFDLGQNFSGWPQLTVPADLPAGTTIRMSPAESLAANGTVDQASLMGGGGSRGRDLFNTYTTSGTDAGRNWHPDFNYFGMQWVQVTGLPGGYTPTKDLITGLRLQAATPTTGRVITSNARINRLHTMARYSFASNIMSVITDCPGREKLSYPADYTMPMSSIHRNYELDAFLRTTMRHLVEGQSIADTPMAGNVALKTPVYDWGYTGRFGDEINWGNAIVLVPSILHELYGDTQTMARYYDQMVDFADYIQRQKVGTGADANIVNAALADWVAADQTSGRITGTWGYYTMITKLAEMAELTGHRADAEKYTRLAADIKAAFNAHFYNSTIRRYTAEGNAGTTGATQTAQALALDAGLVPDAERPAVLSALVELVQAFHPNGEGPHFSGGTIGMAPTVRALMAGNRDDVLWEILQQNDQPSYGYFLEPTPANPNGMTTMGERWNRADSKNHMILAQIEEWFQAGLAGLQAAPGSVAYRALLIQPKVVGDLTFAKGSYQTPQGRARSEWTTTGGRFTLKVEIPPNTTAEVRVPRHGGTVLADQARARFQHTDGDYAVFQVPSGRYTFTAGA